jgi:hypothetical protein
MLRRRKCGIVGPFDCRWNESKTPQGAPGSAGRRSFNLLVEQASEDLVFWNRIEELATSTVLVRSRRFVESRGRGLHTSYTDSAAQGQPVPRALFRAFTPSKLTNCRLKRYGDANDGGYLVCENLMGDAAAAYSNGIDGPIIRRATQPTRFSNPNQSPFR